MTDQPTLREKCVEAASRAIWERNHDDDWFAVKLARTGSYLKARHDATAALVAVLGQEEPRE